jgi:peptidyl-prolyl cis-trans isomerase B (cyclophilin B)
MLRRISTITALLTLAITAFAQDSRASDPAPGMTPERGYCGLRRPAIINVVSSRGFGTVTLQLMNFNGQPLADAVEVHPGRVDLNQSLPAIWNLRKTAYLQMLDLGEPVGNAIVLQPMLSRLVPVTEVRVHPTTGQPHSKIVRWVDENDPSMLAPAMPASAAKPAAPTTPTTPATAPVKTTSRDRPPPFPSEVERQQREAAEAAAAEAERQRLIAEAQAAKEAQKRAAVDRLFSGLRMYRESDVVLHTSRGDIRVCLRPDEAPNTAWNFMQLARDGFYRDITFHRIVPLTANGQPFVIQAGDPTGSGDGGPGYWLPLEDSHLPHDFGVISMARGDDPDSNGSQFFFCLSREGTARLDGQYCSFGYAVEGANVIKAIAESELADVKTGRPMNPPVIRDAELVAAPPRTPGKGRPDAKVSLEAARQPATRPTRVPR